MVQKTVKRAKIILQELLEEKKIIVNKIVLFGSYATGEANKDSDIDFIVVSKDLRNKDIFEKIKLMHGVSGMLVRRIKKPVDILYYSDIEWERGRSLMIHAAKQSGRVLFSS